MLFAYFQRFPFQGHLESTELPLIRNWTDEKLKKRVDNEKRVGFGKQLMVLGYPISSSKHSGLEGLKLDTGFIGDPAKHIVYKIPVGVSSDADIQKMGSDVSHFVLLIIMSMLFCFSGIYCLYVRLC